MKTRRLIIEEADGGWILEVLDWNTDEKCWESNEKRIVVVSQYDLIQEVKNFYGAANA